MAVCLAELEKNHVKLSPAELQYMRDLINLPLTGTGLHQIGISALTHEMFIGTIREAHYVGTGNHSLLRPSFGGSSHRYSPERAIENNKKRLEGWLETPIFERLCNNYGYASIPVARTLHLAMDGHTHLIGKYINQLNRKKQEIVINGERKERQKRQASW